MNTVELFEKDKYVHLQDFLDKHENNNSLNKEILELDIQLVSFEAELKNIESQIQSNFNTIKYDKLQEEMDLSIQYNNKISDFCQDTRADTRIV